MEELVHFLSREDLNPRWFQKAMCTRVTYLNRGDFHYEGRFRGNSKERQEHIDKLRACCDLCPVRQLCDEWAERHEWLHGFWGGVTPEERRQRQLYKKLEGVE